MRRKRPVQVVGAVPVNATETMRTVVEQRTRSKRWKSWTRMKHYRE